MKEDIVKKANSALWLDRNPDKVLDIIQGEHCHNKEELDLLAAAHFELGNIPKALNYYKLAGAHYQEGFCELLLGNEPKAKELWYSIPENSAVLWGRSLLDFINLEIKKLPSFLQIRNFLECDIGHFIRTDNLEYAENLISCNEVLAQLNLESYKFIGRALFNYGFLAQSYKYFEKSRKLIDNDPEIYFHLGQYFYSTNDTKECIKMLDKCVELNKEYTPAIDLKTKALMKG